MQTISYQYDGTWEGLLTAIFEAFDRNEDPVDVFFGEGKRMKLFEEVRSVVTDFVRAERVARGVLKESRTVYKRMYCVFLSEKEEREILCLRLVKLLFENKDQAETDFRNKYVLRAKQINKEVSREVHRMHAFVRFQKAKDQIWYAFIQPDFNVLSLIANHFEKRYADQKWLIYDLKRKYGIYYDLNKVDNIEIDFGHKVKNGRLPDGAAHECELSYQNMWKEYFEHVNIKERKNMSLHIQHVPKRYWHLMTEKMETKKPPIER